MWHRRELTYCSNVHPGVSLSDVSSNIENWIKPVAQKRGLSQMAGGLWLSSEVIDALDADYRKDGVLSRQFSQTLNKHHINITTLNGFPFGDFHQQVVKTKVYEPSWDTELRYQYTLKLATFFARSLDDNTQSGTISTLPLGYKRYWTESKNQQAMVYLCRLAQDLQGIEKNTGKRILVCLEMEPDCVLETTPELVYFFRQSLSCFAREQGLTEELVFRYIACCYDVCHQGVMFEDVYNSMSEITHAGIEIGKVQISNAVSASIRNKDDIDDLCKVFDEPKFLHQVKIKLSEQEIHSIPDLDKEIIFDRIQGCRQVLNKEWRLHFHVPINVPIIEQSVSQSCALSTTQGAILDCLRFLRDSPGLHPTLEVETYTWLQFKKNSQDFDLLQCLYQELSWLERQMEHFGLLVDKRGIG